MAVDVIQLAENSKASSESWSQKNITNNQIRESYYYDTT